MIEILNFRVTTKSKTPLLGFLTVKIPKWGNFIIHDIALFQKSSHRWLSFPCKPVESNGEKKYFNYMRFEKAETMKLFENSVLDAFDLWQKSLSGLSLSELSAKPIHQNIGQPNIKDIKIKKDGSGITSKEIV